MSELGDFWERKMRTTFRVFDYNRDGVLTRQDYEDMAEHFINAGQLTGDKADQLRQKFTQLYEKLSEESGNPEQITEDAYVAGRRKCGKTYLTTATGAMGSATFDLIDTNGDGVIELEEFKIFHQWAKLEGKVTEDTFKALDVDGDGKVSLEEFVTAFVDFTTSDDETSPYQNFFGPLAA